MSNEVAAAAAGAARGAPAIDVRGCSRWYGDVLGVSEVSWTVNGGIFGLLGPNGAGKSTLMKMMVGLLAPSRGTVEIFGASPARSPAVRRRLGYCPEHESLYEELTAHQFVTEMAVLAGVPRSEAGDRAAAALDHMGLASAASRSVRGFSKGMRQRTKLAQCIAHDPDLLILDEPLTGVDPVARADICEQIRRMGASGKTVVISSHVLYEIENLTEEILVIYRGQVLAEGNLYQIRGLIDRHPHRIRVECDAPHQLGRELAAAEHVVRLSFDRSAVVVETRDPDRCYDLIGGLVERGSEVRSLTSPDNNLSAVFQYLVGGSR